MSAKVENWKGFILTGWKEEPSHFKDSQALEQVVWKTVQSQIVWIPGGFQKLTGKRAMLRADPAFQQETGLWPFSWGPFQPE